MKRSIISIVFVIFASACNNNDTASSNDESTISSVPPPSSINYNIVASYPHDTSSYTQGLIWQDDMLFEGTGLEGHSRLMKVELKNGKVSEAINLDPAIFGEGITVLKDKLYQLSWRNNKVFVYDAKTFKKLKEFHWEHEGWGITHNGTDLIVSTGDSNLYFVDPETFKVKNIVGVKDNNGPVGGLNELEFIDGVVYSNIYGSDYIIKIDLSSGNVTGRMDLSGLLEKSGKQVDKADGLVLNGIAYDSTKKSLYVTGKKWPLLYEMKVN